MTDERYDEMMTSRDRTFEGFLELQEARGAETAESQGMFAKLRDRRKTRRVREQASDAAWQEYQLERESGAFDGTFLDWLIANADTIIALIMKIMALFGL